MGYATSAYLVDSFGVSAQALSLHLTHNIWPPVPADRIDAVIAMAMAAIDAVDDDDPNREIPVGDGVTYRDGQAAPAHAVISGFGLYAFVGVEDEADEESS